MYLYYTLEYKNSFHIKYTYPDMTDQRSKVHVFFFLKGLFLFLEGKSYKKRGRDQEREIFDMLVQHQAFSPHDPQQ